MKTAVRLFLILALSLTASLFSEDWPQFKRTPNRQGCSLTESVALPSKLCAWLDFGSPIHASPAVVDGKAYAISGKGLLARVDLAGNSVDWHISLGGVGNESSPSVFDGKVYVGSTAGYFYVLDAATGTVLNQYEAGSPVFASPLLLDSGVYFGTLDAKFHALDLDGNLKWTYQAKNNIIHSAASDSGCIVFCDGNKLLYRFRDLGGAYGVDYISHIFNWSTTSPTSAAPPSGDPFISGPMIWNNGIFMGRGNQEYGNGSHQLTRIDFTTGQFDVTAGPATGVFATPSVDTSTRLVYAGSNNAGLFALRDGLGTWPSWTTTGQYYESTGVWGVNSSPAIISDCVLFGSEQGEVHFFKKDTMPYGRQYGGVQLWSYKCASGKAFDASPAVSNGKVVIGSLDGCLYGFWDGIEAASPVVVDSQTTGISNRNLQSAGTWSLTVFPNPASGAGVTFSMDGLAPGGTISVYSVTGALVGRLGLTGAVVKWDMKDIRGRLLPAGTYFARVSDRTGKTMRSFSIKVAG